MPGRLALLARDVFDAALRAAAPGPALRAALDAGPPPSAGVRIIAVGKAAGAMADAAATWLGERGRPVLGGVVVAPAPVASPDVALTVVAGDHPVPGERSRRAAAAVAAAAAAARPDDEVWVLLSGGTSSLMAAPVDGVAPDELATLFARLLASGLDIHAANRIRKRFLRWGGGRLAAALRGARVRVLALSDVPGDALEDIGSGPCAPDPVTAAELQEHDATVRALLAGLPGGLRAHLEAVRSGRAAETPKPGDPVFARVTSQVIAGNRTAVGAALARARELGFAVREGPPLSGEARPAGRAFAEELCGGDAACLVAGGETTVTLRGPAGRGGRSQELALAAAEVLAALPGEPETVVLAAGTDGRDGPTDAAGAVVDGGTWAAIRRAGVDPLAALDAHDAYHALAAADALVRTGLTGTNVMDLAIGMVGRATPAGDQGWSGPAGT